MRTGGGKRNQVYPSLDEKQLNEIVQGQKIINESNKTFGFMYKPVKKAKGDGG